MGSKILTGAELERLRELLGVSLRKMAEIMCINHASLKRWDDPIFLKPDFKRESQSMLFKYIQKQSSIYHRLSTLYHQNGDAKD